MTEDEIHRENIKKFPALCDKVLRFITMEENKTACYTSKELSGILEIDCDTVDAIAGKFSERKLIKLARKSGSYVFVTLPAAFVFVKESSFVDEANKAEGVSSIYNTGNIISDSKFENIDHSPFLNRDHSRPIDMPNQTAANSSQNSFWAKTLSWIIGHIIQILLGLLLAYLIYRFGWN